MPASTSRLRSIATMVLAAMAFAIVAVPAGAETRTVPHYNKTITPSKIISKVPKHLPARRPNLNVH